MTSKREWTSYSHSFCAREMATLVSWIRTGQSGALIGLPGTGKSNLLRFLCHRPDVVAQYLNSDSARVAVVQVDLNNLTGSDLATLYRVMLRSLCEAGAQLLAIEPALFDIASTTYRRVEEKTDPFVCQSAVREVLIAFLERQARLVLVMDPFDQLGRTASVQVLDNLRGLRDSFKYTLTYIVGLRHELAYIRDPREMGELYEILDSHVCWMGALAAEDARYSISQVAEATGRSFAPTQIEQLIHLTGSYPTLLRAATLWLAEVAPVPDASAWENCLFAEPSIQNRLNDVWQALTGEEQTVLSILQTALAAESPKERGESLRQIEEKYRSVLAQLQSKSLCAQDSSDWRLFGPLFARFVVAQGSISIGKVRHDPRMDRFFRGDMELTGLSEQDRRLLRHFLEQPAIAHNIDDLVEAAWADVHAEGVSNVAVQQAIRHLRKQIEPNPANPSYLITAHGTGYRFFPEGAPQG